MFGSHIHLVGKHPTLISIVRSALSRDEKNPVDSHHRAEKENRTNHHHEVNESWRSIFKPSALTVEEKAEKSMEK